jgi:ribosomal protein S28E/S33
MASAPKKPSEEKEIIFGIVKHVICRAGKSGECTYARVVIQNGPDQGRVLNRLIRGLVQPGDKIELKDTKHEHPLIKQTKR